MRAVPAPIPTTNGSTDGDVLTSTGSGLAPAWEAAAGGAPLSDATPAALGTAAAGVGTDASRDDHVHGVPTSLRESSGPTTLTIGAIADGSVIRRVGTTLVGAVLASFTVTESMVNFAAGSTWV